MNQSIKLYAREMRKNGTKAQRILWKKLLSKNQTGYRFLRQRIIDYYVVDFFCYELQLVIEVDGNSHDAKSTDDDTRQEYIEKQGLTVIYFKESDIVYRFEAVQRNILAIIDSRKNHNFSSVKKRW